MWAKAIIPNMRKYNDRRRFTYSLENNYIEIYINDDKINMKLYRTFTKSSLYDL